MYEASQKKEKKIIENCTIIFYQKMDKEARLEKIHKSRFNAASRILRIFQMVFYTIDARRDVATF